MTRRCRDSYGFVLQIVAVAVIVGLAHGPVWVGGVVGVVNGVIATAVWLGRRSSDKGDASGGALTEAMTDGSVRTSPSAHVSQLPDGSTTMRAKGEVSPQRHATVPRR